MNIAGSRLKRQFAKQRAALHQAGRSPTVESYLSSGKKLEQFCADLNELLERVPTERDPRQQGDLLALASLRCEALRRYASHREDGDLVGLANKLLHHIEHFAERESPEAWKLVAHCADQLPDREADTARAFQEELERVRKRDLVPVETFLEKGRTLRDYAERIHWHLLDAEGSDDAATTLHELAKAMLQAESLRRHAARNHRKTLEGHLRAIERDLREFVASDSDQAWARVRQEIEELLRSLGDESRD